MSQSKEQSVETPTHRRLLEGMVRRIARAGGQKFPALPPSKRKVLRNNFLILLIAFEIFLILGTHPSAGYAGDFAPQYLAGAKSWPEPYRDIPLRPSGVGFYGIFLPWAVIPFLPALFVPNLFMVAGWRALTVLSLWWLTRYNLRATILTLTSPVGIVLLGQANLDGVVAAGTLALPLPAAWLIASMKPQVVLAVGPLLLLRKQWAAILPALVVVGGSTLLWSEWLERVRLAPQGLGWGVSLWPFLVPLGLLLFWRAWRDNDPEMGVIASPWFAPYFAPYGLAPVLAIVAARWPRLGLVAWVALWILYRVGEQFGQVIGFRGL